MLVTQAASGGQDIAFEAADELVVIGHRAVEAIAHALEVFGGDGKAVVKLPAHASDLPCLARQPVLPPDLRHRARDGDKVGRAGQQHATFEGVIPQTGVLLERGGNEMLTRHEHQHVIGRVLELALVGFCAQRLDMIAHRLDVGVQCDLAGIVVLRLERILIGVERNLGVDHQQLVARYAHDRIGTQPSFIGIDRMFGDEIGVFGKAALFQHVAQLQFAPAPACFRAVAQAVAKLRCGGAHGFLPIAHRLDQAGQVAERIDALLLQLPDLFFIAFQPLVHGREQRFQPFGARFLAFLEAGLRAGEEGFLRLFQHLVARILEFLAQRLLRLDQHPLLFGEVFGIGLQAFECGAEGFTVSAHLRQFGTHNLRIGGLLPRCGERRGQFIAITAHIGQLSR